MDSLKEIWDTFNSRVKSPVMGSIALSFIVANWKPLFFLLFSNAATLDKFTYFDDKTNIWTILITPIIFGLLLAYISPWVSYFSTFIAQIPVKKKKSLQNKLSHDLLIERQNLERARNRLIEQEERNLIDRAKRDEEVQSEIKNDEIRQELQGQIEELRNSVKSQSANKSSISLTDAAKRHIEIIEGRINRFESDLEIAQKLDSYSEVHNLEEAIINELKRIDRIRNGNEHNSESFGLDDTIPF